MLFQDRFDRPDGLVTNEWAFSHPDDRDAVVSPDWYMTSGSLFTSGQVGWSGVPDRRAPDAVSAKGTGSAVFRLVTHRRDFGNVAVSFSLRNDEVMSTASTPPVAWDGVHVFLRYQSPDRLYSASANRRDGTVVIKKKCPGGPSNGGSYYSLSPSSVYAVPYGEWQRVVATVRNLTPVSVELRLEIGGRIVAAAVDDGLGCAPITVRRSGGHPGRQRQLPPGQLRRLAARLTRRAARPLPEPGLDPFGPLLFKDTCDRDYLMVGERPADDLERDGQSVMRLPNGNASDGRPSTVTAQQGAIFLKRASKSWDPTRHGRNQGDGKKQDRPVLHELEDARPDRIAAAGDSLVVGDGRLRGDRREPVSHRVRQEALATSGQRRVDRQAFRHPILAERIGSFVEPGRAHLLHSESERAKAACRPLDDFDEIAPDFVVAFAVRPGAGQLPDLDGVGVSEWNRHRVRVEPVGPRDDRRAPSRHPRQNG